MGAPSKRAKRIRVAEEFDLGRLEAMLRMPRDGRTTINAWSLDDIKSARDEQMIGQFVRPARMAEQMRTDDALAVAYENRLAPQRCIPIELCAAKGARGASIAGEAEALYGAQGVGIRPGTIADVHGDLVNHGIAFGTLAATPREDGSRVDLELRYWPIEYVRWDPVFRVFKARANPETVQEGDLHHGEFDFDGTKIEYGFVGGYWIPIVHGDGRWVIFTKHDIEPFRKEAAILPAAIVWARHAFATRDWAKGSVAHGNAKVVGEMPEGVPLQSANGQLSNEAAAFLELLRAIGTADSPIGIRPAGSKTDFLVNNSTAWQVWAELVSNAEKAAARIYLGTDGTLGAQGGAPGVDITALFGVASTKVRGDLECISRAINSGVIQPWCAINFGDSALAPEHRYCVPNDDEEKLRENTSTRVGAFYTALKDARAAGLTLTPVYIAGLATDYGVRVPELAAPIAAAPAISPPPAPAAPAEGGK